MKSILNTHHPPCTSAFQTVHGEGDRKNKLSQKKHGIRISMTEDGNPKENPQARSFAYVVSVSFVLILLLSNNIIASLCLFTYFCRTN